MAISDMAKTPLSKINPNRINISTAAALLIEKTAGSVMNLRALRLKGGGFGL